MLPNLAGGKLYSDNAGRLVFFLFLIFSIPVGVHHQFGDPSITRGVKLAQSILTFGVGRCLALLQLLRLQLPWSMQYGVKKDEVHGP